MAKIKQAQISDEVVAEALKIARATQKPGQTKEQTQLIARGIEKGIAEYKKQQKARSRAADRAKKQRLKENSPTQEPVLQAAKAPSQRSVSWLPWSLLILSWLSFAAYVVVV